MALEQSGKVGGVPERFAPDEMRGQLIEAEHLARYRWAATVAAGKRVLDAGCGTAYGTAMLAEGGATAVVGVDLAESVLDSVRDQMPETVELRVADLTALDLPDDSFDLVVCFEVVEHFEDPFTILDQLTRVLAPDGVLLVSSPNRGVYPSGNPHHFHEFKPAELREELGKRLANVQLMRQETYVTSAILADGTYESSSTEPLADLPLYKLVEQDPDTETFTLAVAGDGKLPVLSQVATMTGRLGIQEFVETMDEQEASLQRHRQYIAELETQVADRTGLQEQLLEVEQKAADVPGMRTRVIELETALHETRAELMSFSDELNATKNSFSWRVTRPLRDGKTRLRALLPGRR
jgi:2-polyprenyl-3-methyl-5-hydroxy-6-metoxy-1,4-benzoquinol methylase